MCLKPESLSTEGGGTIGSSITKETCNILSPHMVHAVQCSLLGYSMWQWPYIAHSAIFNAPSIYSRHHNTAYSIYGNFYSIFTQLPSQGTSPIMGMSLVHSPVHSPVQSPESNLYRFPCYSRKGTPSQLTEILVPMNRFTVCCISLMWETVFVFVGTSVCI